MLINAVAPFAGAWIEMERVNFLTKDIQSLPSRERGLKSLGMPIYAEAIEVAPFAGAWIEIKILTLWTIPLIVAPFAGAWIEIRQTRTTQPGKTSLPSRERGLKYVSDQFVRIGMQRRSLRGSVD